MRLNRQLMRHARAIGSKAWPWLLLALLPLTAQATIYRWVDAQGQVHYSQTPPPEAGAEPQSIRTLPAAAPPAARQPASTAPGAGGASAPPPAGKTEEARKAEAAARPQRCQAAREHLRYLEEKTPRRLGVTQPDGSMARMTEEEFAGRLRTTREAIARDCEG